MAQQIASEVLRDNVKLRGVHSKDSIKAILEKEAKKQMVANNNNAINQGAYVEHVVNGVVKSVSVNKAEPSNLPYLHKHPAV
jgi:ribose 1,5-bisphosphokinase PhnN